MDPEPMDHAESFQLLKYLLIHVAMDRQAKFFGPGAAGQNRPMNFRKR